jgi:hypothetical protein
MISFQNVFISHIFFFNVPSCVFSVLASWLVFFRLYYSLLCLALFCSGFVVQSLPSG